MIKIIAMIPHAMKPGTGLNVTSVIKSRIPAREMKRHCHISFLAAFRFLMVLHNVAVDFICFLQCICDALKLFDDSFALKVVHIFSI